KHSRKKTMTVVHVQEHHKLCHSQQQKRSQSVSCRWRTQANQRSARRILWQKHHRKRQAGRARRHRDARERRNREEIIVAVSLCETRAPSAERRLQRSICNTAAMTAAVFQLSAP